jgi:hypothetical protein
MPIIIAKHMKNKGFMSIHWSYFALASIVFFLLLFPLQANATAAPADINETCSSCGCESTCQTEINTASSSIQDHYVLEFDHLRQWIVNDWFYNPTSPFKQLMHALTLTTTQLTTIGIQQVQMIGGFFDAKHQLETQRLFQQLSAQAHKDYQPSEGLCQIGTSTIALAQSERISDLTQRVLTERSLDRTLLSRFTSAGMGEQSDRVNRINQFINVFCNPKDNADGLALLCGKGGVKTQYIMDVDFTSALENKLTLDMNLMSGVVSPDQQNIFALNANLFSHQVLYPMPDRILADGYRKLRDIMSDHIRQRAIAAKRSVAQNTFSALAAMRASGSGENAPFLKATIRELGVNASDVTAYLGGSPSYFAQMEVLTKKIYQNPQFYSNLYDKPINVERKGVAMQAIGIMQDRDIYDSLIRSEAVLATLLETLMHKEHERISSSIGAISEDEKWIRPEN